MNVREWALIAFSIFAQMSVGSFLVLGVVHFFATRKTDEEQADRLSDRALLAIGPVLVLGLIASLAHLGNPINAYRAVANLGSSWLSREIFFGVLFAVLGGAFALMQWRKLGSTTVRHAVAWVATLVGLLLVYSMAQIYMLPTQPAWNSLATPVTFFTTTLLLGALATGAAFVANYAYVQRQEPECADVQCELLRGSLRWIAVASILLLGLEFLVAPLYVASLSAQGGAAAVSAGLMVNSYGAVFALRLALVFLGAGVLAMFVYQNALSPGQERVVGYLTYAAFGLVLVSEVLGRFLFYAIQVGVGI